MRATVINLLGILDFIIRHSKKNTKCLAFVFTRYAVKPQEDHVASVQFGTSKSDVYISLQVLDHEEELASTAGKGHAVIPAFTFLRDKEPGEEERRSGSRVCE